MYFLLGITLIRFHNNFGDVDPGVPTTNIFFSDSILCSVRSLSFFNRKTLLSQSIEPRYLQ